MGLFDLFLFIKWGIDDVKDRVEDVKDNVVEKTQDAICDALDSAEKKVTNFCDDRIAEIEQFEDDLDIMFSKDLNYDGHKKGYELAATQYETAFENIKKEYTAVIKLTKEEKELYTKKITEQIKKLEKLEDKQKEIEQLRYQKVASMYSGVASLDSFQNQSHIGNTILVGYASGKLYNFFMDKKRKKYYEAQERGFKEARDAFEKKLQQLKKDYENAVKERNDNMEGKEKILKKLLKSIEEKEILIAEMTVLINVKEH